MMNSFNHYSLGSVGQWLYEHVGGHPRGGAGLRARRDRARAGRAGVGARRVPVGARHDLERLAARGGELHLEVEIPPNVTATVIVPGGETVEVGSGRHAFTAAASPIMSP